MTNDAQDLDGWQPIETAPKDGTEFQAWVVNDVAEFWEPKCRYDEYETFQIWGRVGYDEDGWDVYTHLQPTHWMPLPAPPGEKPWTQDEREQKALEAALKVQKRMGTMTPKNREELLEEIADGITDYDLDWQAQDSPGKWKYDRCAYYVLEKLDAAGLAIVPKEPTNDMSHYGGIAQLRESTAKTYGDPVITYRAMLEASPYRAKLDGGG